MEGDAVKEGQPAPSTSNDGDEYEEDPFQLPMGAHDEKADFGCDPGDPTIPMPVLGHAVHAALNAPFEAAKATGALNQAAGIKGSIPPETHLNTTMADAGINQIDFKAHLKVQGEHNPVPANIECRNNPAYVEQSNKNVAALTDTAAAAAAAAEVPPGAIVAGEVASQVIQSTAANSSQVAAETSQAYRADTGAEIPAGKILAVKCEPPFQDKEK